MSSTSAANLFSVRGMVAVVTGGGTGIGLLMAKALEENGAKVYIIGRRMEVLEKAAQQAKHQNIVPLQADVTKKDDLLRIVKLITEKDGFINVLIANSGISGPNNGTVTTNIPISTFSKNLWETSSDEFNQTFDVNLTSVFFSIAAFLELLDAGNKKGNVEQKSQVIATASGGAFNRSPLAGWAYAASKAGLVHMMKQCATMFVPYDIRSNVIAPGLYPSEMATGPIEKLKDAEGLLPRSIVPLRRAGTEEDNLMAGNILFLTSRAGAYLNGNVLLTDGGRLSIVPASY